MNIDKQTEIKHALQRFEVRYQEDADNMMTTYFVGIIIIIIIIIVVVVVVVDDDDDDELMMTMLVSNVCVNRLLRVQVSK